MIDAGRLVSIFSRRSIVVTVCGNNKALGFLLPRARTFSFVRFVSLPALARPPPERRAANTGGAPSSSRAGGRGKVSACLMAASRRRHR